MILQRLYLLASLEETKKKMNNKNKLKLTFVEKKV
jgi:hypothetical protein